MGCQKGLLRCRVTDTGQLEIVQVEEEYSNLYIVNVVWCGGSRFIVVSSRPKYSKTKLIPKGEKNFAIATFTLYNSDETEPSKSQVVLGHYSTSFDQACFPIVKVQVIVPRNESSVPVEEQLDSEIPFRGRFYLTMVETHLKVIDTVNQKVYDLLSEPNFDQDSVSGMALIRSLTDK